MPTKNLGFTLETLGTEIRYGFHVFPSSILSHKYIEYIRNQMKTKNAFISICFYIQVMTIFEHISSYEKYK